ncbi:MAG: agmatinase family protein [Haloplanus sp.]
MSDQRPPSAFLDSGVATFMGADQVDPYDPAAMDDHGTTLGVVGFPFDSTCISRTGTNMGPRAIRDASTQTRYYHFEYDTDLQDHYTFADCGDVPVIPGNAAESLDRGADLLSRVLDAGAMPVMLGGDHVTTVSGVRALADHADDPGLVLVDTHFDTAKQVAGERYNHCCPIARAVDEAGFDPEKISIVGLSAPTNPREELEVALEQGMNLYSLDEVARRGAATVAREATAAANDGSDAVYLTLDIDVLDAGSAPGTGVPTNGGLTTRELLQILGVVASEGIDAMDVVETSPQLDPAGVTSRMAVRSIVDALAANAISEAHGIGMGTAAAENCRKSRE